MDKREQIERALGRFVDLDLVALRQFWEELDIEALAEQAIVIECEVEHHTCCIKQHHSPLHEHAEECGWDTIISLATQTFFGDTIRQIGFRGRHGTPGKALAIIVPLEEE